MNEHLLKIPVRALTVLTRKRKRYVCGSCFLIREAQLKLATVTDLYANARVERERESEEGILRLERGNRG